MEGRNPSINYIWVGPPSPNKKKQSDYGIELPGHDVGGPIEMAKKNNTNHIIFWCLDVHVDAYKKTFKNNKNIQVCSIEKYINDAKEKGNNDAAMMETILQQSLRGNKKADKVPVRDRVTVKDAFTLFLHANNNDPMYTFDTNVKPSGYETNVNLPYFSKFHIPYITETQTDFWAIYSSDMSKEIPQESFQRYYQYWTKIQEEFTGNYDDTYETKLGIAMSESIGAAMMNNRRLWNPWNTSFNEEFQMEGTFPSTGTIIGTDAIPIKKTYDNTHKVENMLKSRFTPDPLSKSKFPVIEEKLEKSSPAKLKKQNVSNIFESSSQPSSPQPIQEKHLSVSARYEQEDDFTRVILAVKNYIAIHDWKLSPGMQLGTFQAFTGGKTITLDDGSQKTVPSCIQRQWNAIKEWETLKPSAQDFSAQDFCLNKLLPLSEEEANLSKTKKTSSFGSRQDDTIEYLDSFTTIDRLSHFADTLEKKAALEMMEKTNSILKKT